MTWRRRQADPATLAAIADADDDLRALAVKEARLRQQLGLPPGPTFHDEMTMTEDQLVLEHAKLRMQLGLPADDAPGGAS